MATSPYIIRFLLHEYAFARMAKFSSSAQAATDVGVTSPPAEDDACPQAGASGKCLRRTL
jgi:hypothetical protein